MKISGPFTYQAPEETEEERRRRLALVQLNYQQFKPDAAGMGGTPSAAPSISTVSPSFSTTNVPSSVPQSAASSGTDWRPSYQRTQGNAASTSAQDWRPSYQREITPSPVTRTNEEGFNLPAAFGSALEEIGTKYRNMSAGENISRAMQAEKNQPVTYGEWGRSLNNVHAGAKWTTYLSLLTPEERRHAETLSGEKLGEYVNSLNLEQRAQTQDAEQRRNRAAELEASVSAAKPSFSTRGIYIAEQVLKKQYATDWHRSQADFEKQVQSQAAYRASSFLTDQQKETIRRYADAGDFKAVEDYYQSLSRDLEAKAQDAIDEAQRKKSGSSGLSAAASAPASGVVNIAAGIPALGAAVWQHLKNELTGEYTPVNYNSPAFSLVHLSQAMQEGGQGYINERFQDDEAARTGWNIVYGGVSSGITNAGQLLLGSKLLGLSGTALEQFTLGTMSLSAAGQSAYGNLRGGQDLESSLANGIVSGLIEYMTETAPIHLWTQNMEKLASGQVARTAKNLMGMFAVRAGSEAWEEVVGNVTEQTWDLLFNGQNSAYSSAVREIIAAKEQASGRTATEEDWKSAREQAFIDLFVVQSLEEAASAAVSVLFMDGVPMAAGSIHDRYAFGTAGRDIRRTGGKEAVQREIEKGLLFPEDSPAHVQAERAARIVAKGNLSNQELGRLSFLNGNAVAGLLAEIEGNGNQYAQARIREVLREAAGNPMDKVTVETVRELLDLSNGAAPSFEAYQARNPLAEDERQSIRQSLDLTGPDGKPLAAFREFMDSFRAERPEMTEDEGRQLYSQYLGDAMSVTIDGEAYNFEKFWRKVRETDSGVTPDEAAGMFHNLLTAQLADGMDAGERIRQSRTEREQQEDDLPFYFGSDEQSANAKNSIEETGTTAKNSGNPVQNEESRNIDAAMDTAGTSIDGEMAKTDREAAADRSAVLEDVEPGLDYSDRVTAEAARSLDSAAQDTMDTLGKLLGKRIRIANSVEGGISNGEIYGNDIVLDRAMLEDEKPETLKWKVLGHELTHGIQQDAPEAYARFREAAAQEDAVREHARQIQAVYKLRGRNITDAAALDEAAADYGGDILSNTDAAERFIERNRQDKPLLTRIRDAIVRLIRRLSGAEKRQLQTVRGLYDAALDAAAKAVREGTTKPDSTARFSVKEASDGRKYVDVDMDQELFDGLSINEMQTLAKKEILSRFRGKVIGTDYTAFVKKESAEHYSYPANRRMDLQQKEDKMRASPELDHIMEAAVYRENVPDDGRHPAATGGLDKLDVRFRVGSRMYDAEITVLVTDRGRVFYDMTKFKDITGREIGQTLNSAAETSGNVPTDSIPRSAPESKGKLSLKGTEDAEQLRMYEALVQRNQELEAEVSKWQKKRQAEKSLSNARKNVVIGEVHRFADSFLPRWDSGLSRSDVRPGLLKLMNLLKAGPEGDGRAGADSNAALQFWNAALDDQARELASKIVMSAVRETEHPELDTLKSIRAELKQARISYEDMRGTFSDSKDFNAWRQRNQFRMGLRKDGHSIDTYWADWGQRYGYDFFPSDIDSPTDMLLHLEGLLDSAEPTYENPFAQFDTLEVVEDCKNDLLRQAMDFVAGEFIPLNERQAIRDAAYARGVQDERRRIEKQLDKARKAVQRERDRGAERLRNFQAEAKEHQDASDAASEEKKLFQQLNRLMARKNRQNMTQRDRAVLNSIYSNLSAIAEGKLGITPQEVYANQMYLWDLLDENSPHYDEDFVRNPKIFTVSGQVGLQETLGEKKLTPAEMKELKDRTAEMSVEQLQRVAQYLMALDTAQRNIDHLIRSEDRRNLNQLADTAIDHVRAAKPFTPGGKFLTPQLRPTSFAKRITGYALDDSIVKGIQGLQKGERDAADYYRRALNYTLGRFAYHYGVKDWNSRDPKRRAAAVMTVTDALRTLNAGESAKEENLIKVTGTDNNTKQLADAWITKDMRAAIYMYTQNPQNMNHLKWGGATIPGVEGYKAYRKGKSREAFGEGHVILRFTLEQAEAIVSQMSPVEKALAAAHEDYTRNMSQRELTPVAEAVKGWSPFNVPHYYHIETNQSFNRTDYGRMMADGTIYGMGFTKERQDFAGNPVILRGLSEVLMDEIEQHARFIGLSIPVRNMSKLLNRNRAIVEDETEAVRGAFSPEDAARIESKARRLIESGRADENNAIRLAVREVMGSEGMENLRRFQSEELPEDRAAAMAPEYRSVKDAIKRQFGDEAVKYLDDLMEDFTLPKKSGSSYKKAVFTLTSNLAQSTLTLSGSVAPVQFSSYPTAAAVIGGKPLIKALKHFPTTVTGHSDLELRNVYTSRFWERGQGFITNEAKILKGDSGGINTRFKPFNATVNFMTGKFRASNWIQGMDLFATDLLWPACEYYVEENQPDLAKDKGSREEILAGNSAFYQAVAEVYNRVIEETQPSYGTAERNAVLRDKSDIVRLTNMFKTQLFQNLNILYDAFGELGARKRDYDGNKNKETESRLTAAKTGAQNAVLGLAFAQFLASFMKFLWNRVTGNDKQYRDAEGNLTIPSQLKGIALGTVASFPGMVTWGTEIFSAATYAFDRVFREAMGKDPFFNQAFYGVSVQVFQSGENAVKHVTSMAKAIVAAAHGVSQGLDAEGNGYHVNWQDIVGKSWTAAEDLLMLGGIPARNARKILTGAARLFAFGVFGSTIGEYNLLHLSSDPQENAGQYYDLLFRAGGRKLYPDPEGKDVPEDYRELHKRMVADGFDPDEMQAKMKDKYLKTREYAAAYADYRTALAKEVASLPGWQNMKNKGKASEDMNAAAKYVVLSTNVKGYNAGKSETWVKNLADFGEKYRVSIAPLILVRSGTSGIESLRDNEEKAISGSAGLQQMELAYQLYPQLSRWPEERRTEFFLLLDDVGKTIAGWTRDEVLNGKTEGEKHKSGLNEMRQIAKS